MLQKIDYVYWDSCVFISYLQEEPIRVNTVEALFTEVRQSAGKKKIVTSVYSRAEVAYIAGEVPLKQLNDDAPIRIDRMWNDTSVISFIEMHEMIATMARNLIRTAASYKWKLKPADAVHLASAQWLNAQEFHTYDNELYRYSDLIGRPVRAPVAKQPLFNQWF